MQRHTRIGAQGDLRKGARYENSKRMSSEGLIGAAEGTRTPDPLITNEVLYQLSYRGIRSIDPDPLIPAQAGIQGQELGPRFRGDERVSDPISLAPEYRYAPKTART